MASKNFSNTSCLMQEEFEQLLKDFIAETEPLDNFTLNYSGEINPEIITESIASAVSKNVRILRVTVLNDIDVDLPENLFTCSTLESLLLEGCLFANLSDDMPIHFPRLQILKLLEIGYSHGKVLTRIISGCPVLRSLYLDMRVTNELDDEDSEEVLEGIVISSPTLTHLELLASADPITALELPSLEFAGIDARQNCTSLRGIVRAIRHVRSLNISSHKAFRLLRNRIDFRQFERLTSLTVTAGLCQWRNLFDVLSKLPNLDVLRFNKAQYCDCSQPHIPWTAPDHVPDCFLSSPLSVFISDFQGLADELAVVEYILRHAPYVKLHVNRIPGNNH